MKRTSFGDWQCSVARTVDVIGEVWTPLILRDLFWGVTRFEELLTDLGVSRNILSDRLKTLLAHGIVEKFEYQVRPARYEYRLTEKGLDLFQTLLALLAWGDRWQDDGADPPVRVIHRSCDAAFTPRMGCSECGQPVSVQDVDLDFRVVPAVLRDASVR